MGTYRDLLAWQRAMDLADEIYRAVRSFPKSELFVLSYQLRSAALSIPSNIAEGRGRYTSKDQARFYVQARASCSEVETQIELAIRQQFMAKDRGNELLNQSAEVGRLINGLINSLGPRA